jgi:membrane protein DedA with SNARE-associated domain
VPAIPIAAAAAGGGWVHDAMRDGGYAGLFGLLVAENVFPPIPSEVVLPLAGFYVGQGVLAFVPALLVATLGSVAGALILYAAGRVGGRPLLLRWGRVLRVDAARLDVGDRWFAQHGGKIVLAGRLVPGARSLVSIPAGVARMPLGRFVVLTALGSGVWNAALIGAGWALGSRWDSLEGIVGPAGRIVLVALVLVVATAALMAWRRRRVRRPA